MYQHVSRFLFGIDHKFVFCQEWVVCWFDLLRKCVIMYSNYTSYSCNKTQSFEATSTIKSLSQIAHVQCWICCIMYTPKIPEIQCLLFFEVVSFVEFDKTLSQLLCQRAMNCIYLRQALLAIKFRVHNLSLIFCHHSNLVAIMLASDLNFDENIA